MAYRITDICVACGTCIDECPVGAISEGDIYKIDENACVSCGTCAGAGGLIAHRFKQKSPRFAWAFFYMIKYPMVGRNRLLPSTPGK